MALPDIQKTPDSRGIEIDHVGVTGIKMPVRLLRKTFPDEPTRAVTLDTVGVFELSCQLPHHVKGTHMSRFTEVLMEHVDADGIFSHDQLITVARELQKRLESPAVRVYLEVDYFVDQLSPATGKKGIAPLKGVLEVSLVHTALTTKTGIVVDGKTCCPCSREISDYDHATGMGKGAHSQRGTIAITVEHTQDQLVWFEDLLAVAWNSFSSPVYPVLKRPDERSITMAAYANPKFVEDVARDAAMGLMNLTGVLRYKVRVDNAESIHYHNAWSIVTG